MSTHIEPGGPALSDLALVWARTRSAADLAALRDAVRRSPGFDPGLDVVDAVAPALARGDHAEAASVVQRLMPGAFFSPSAHAALAAAHAGLGDDARARAERGLQALAIQSIRSTGDGTREHPWSVLRISDEYDVLRAERRTSQQQTLVAADGAVARPPRVRRRQRGVVRRQPAGARMRRALPLAAGLAVAALALAGCSDDSGRRRDRRRRHRLGRRRRGARRGRHR